MSLHTYSRLIKDVSDMRDETASPNVTTHKEENKGRKVSDAHDRSNIRDKLKTCADPLNRDDHPDGIMNIVSGQIGTDAVNVDEAVYIGKKQMSDYEMNWPDSFHRSLSKKVVTMNINKKSVRCGSGDIYDTKLIYSRLHKP